MKLIQEFNEATQTDDVIEKMLEAFANDSMVGHIDDDIDLITAFDIASKRLDSAKRAVTLVNKLKDPETKKMHASRVFSNINIIKGLLSQILKNIQVQYSLAQDTIQRSKVI